jgi:hypothetical protein
MKVTRAAYAPIDDDAAAKINKNYPDFDLSDCSVLQETLPFFRDQTLVTTTFRRENSEKYESFIFYDDEVFLIDGTQQQLAELNRHCNLQINRLTAVSYLRFVSDNFNPFPDGFRLIESFDDIPNIDKLDIEQRQIFSAKLDQQAERIRAENISLPSAPVGPMNYYGFDIRFDLHFVGAWALNGGTIELCEIGISPYDFISINDDAELANIGLGTLDKVFKRQLADIPSLETRN